MRWQIRSLWGQLDTLNSEIADSRGQIRRLARDLPVVERLLTIPGVALIISSTIVAWIVSPPRFDNRNAKGSYAGLGLGQGKSNWQPIGPAKASRRGNRGLKGGQIVCGTVRIRASGLDSAY